MKIESEPLKKLWNNKFIKWVLIPFFLLGLWFFLSLLYSSYKSFTVLQYFHQTNGEKSEIQLLSGDKITGEFEAKEDNLGIVSVKFGKVPRVDYNKEDELLFRIKEKGSRGWWYENNYRSGLIESNKFFTFGFPMIEDSSGKAYVFELISEKGNVLNGVYIEEPISFSSKYKFSISEIIQTKNTVVDFAVKKIVTFFTNYDALISSSIFLLPLVYYITISLLLNRRKDKYQKSALNRLFPVLVVLLLTADILLLERLVSGFILGLIGFWVTAIYINKYDSNKTYMLACVIAMLTVLFLYSKLGGVVNKASFYVYLLIALGLIQDIFFRRGIRA